MFKSRAEVDADLFQLRASLPLWWRALASQAELHAQYTAMAERLVAAAAPHDRARVSEHLNRLIPGVRLVPEFLPMPGAQRAQAQPD